MPSPKKKKRPKSEIREKPVAKTPDLSILIVNWNTRDFLEKCLRSIVEADQEILYELIVVDNDSSDGSAAMVRDCFPGVTLIANRDNLGFARGNNQAYRVSTGRNVLLLNPDTEVRPGALKALVRFADDHPDGGLVSARLVNPDDSFQPFYARLPNLAMVFFCRTDIGVWFDKKVLNQKVIRWWTYDEHGEFDRVTCLTDGGAGFACTVIRRDVIQKMGFLDERFPVFFNDGDMGARLINSGYKAYIIPQAKVVHHKGGSIRLLSGMVFSEEYAVALRRYFHKHAPGLYATTVDAILLHQFLFRLAKTSVKVSLGKKRPADLLNEAITYCRISGKKVLVPSADTLPVVKQVERRER